MATVNQQNHCSGNQELDEEAIKTSGVEYKSFVTVVKPGDKVARIRAQMLHILYEIGRETYQFRLRYNGQYLRDAFSLEDYELESNAVVKMVPLSEEKDDMSDLRSLSSSLTMNFDPDLDKIPSVKSALYYEVRHFDRRERIVKDMWTMLYCHLLSLFLALITDRWYSVFWLAVFAGIAWYLVPGYTRIGGYIGNTFHIRYWFCGVVGILSVACMAVSTMFAVTTWQEVAFCGVVGILSVACMAVSTMFAVTTLQEVAGHGCDGGDFTAGCSRKNVFTASFFTINAVMLLITFIICALLVYSFRIEVGDVIVRYLVQERDIEAVMRAARSSRVKERRTAAYELATMAASSDDNKFRIVAEGGLDVLIGMSLINDGPTQEYAVEALSELITIQSIQDNFVEVGGVRNLTALLHSANARIMQEAARALYTICQSDDNRHAMVEDHGMSDLAYAARYGSIETQRIVASIFLELVFNSEIRAQLTTRNIPAQALVHLCRSNDLETLRFALLTLELLAIESSDVVCAQEELLEILLEIPIRMMDKRLNLLAGKILLYFAENHQSKETMLSVPDLKNSLLTFAQSLDPILQKVVIKIIFCMMDTKQLKERARTARLVQVLSFCADNAADRDVWDMADQGIQVMNSDEDNFPVLPVLSTIEKLSMGQKDSQFGSRASLRSHASSSDSAANMRS